MASRLHLTGHDGGYFAGQIRSVVIVHHEGPQITVPGELLDRPNISSGSIKSFRDGRMTEAVGPNFHANGFPQLLDDPLDASPSEPASLPCPVEIHKQGTGIRASEIDPSLEGLLRGHRQGQLLLLGPALADDSQGAGLQIGVFEIQSRHLSPPEGQVVHEPD